MSELTVYSDACREWQKRAPSAFTHETICDATVTHLFRQGGKLDEITVGPSPLTIIECAARCRQVIVYDHHTKVVKHG